MKTNTVNYKAMIETLKDEIADLEELYEKYTNMGMSAFLTGQKLNKKREDLDALIRFTADLEIENRSAV